MSNPLDEITAPCWCHYADCDAGPFANGDEIDEHITEEHIAAAVWDFAFENMRGVPQKKKKLPKWRRAS